MFKINIGSKIKKLRNDRGYTQDYLSKQLHISRKTISGWENNRSLPDIYSLLKIGKIFGVSSDELLKDENLLKEFSDNKKVNSKKRILIYGSYMLNIILCFSTYFYLINSIDFHNLTLHLIFMFNIIIYIYLYPYKIHKNIYFYLTVFFLFVFDFFFFNILFNNSLINDLPEKSPSYVLGATYGTFCVDILILVSSIILIFMNPLKKHAK
ncbi:helix-turn-helix domain-containing protein [Apilactobacillus timberlakei]|uniref:helix-turn-helix domain-containing protein n=1 Tax=Apilactobacillus timberlakei TaxID=2008380 RepID=UPI0011289E6A|nr:helix-turn-helix transcriptional regulator [Apilactobacillus timberlakei]TPR19311.1 XRE family transcriptional regulator [Apilactobacillus timberlakei]TPR19670.1 XRE family transcriptional regulator [Apilactobacillus timberlakei]TPR20647.1 XRE family transcriptional regulator [Apilactobacillus timberlakei]TPR22690.1 XRE family transcriptional regulator [Apilactobacillus timberlakei]TPR23151.1 XRE family transcriptional regulator [Apilactobacillus timberlakei]